MLPLVHLHSANVAVMLQLVLRVLLDRHCNSTRQKDFANVAL